MSNHDPFFALSTSLILMVKDELDAQLQGSHIGQRQITQFNKLHQPSFTRTSWLLSVLDLLNYLLLVDTMPDPNSKEYSLTGRQTVTQHQQG